ACGPGETCMGGVCRCGGGGGCSAGTACCGSGASASCTRLDTVANCGACGRTCSGSQQCCDGNCVDVQRDPSNCGSCGRSCSNDATDSCTGGVCTCGSGAACSPG